MPKIVVVGAGVSGLTSAYLLSKSKNNTITVVAKFMPGDYDAEYASPTAGANVLPMAMKGDNHWETRSWPELKRLAAEVPEAGIHLQKARVFRREEDMELLQNDQGYVFDGLFRENPWYKNLFEDFRELLPSELLEGMASGCEFGSLCINTAIYLPWLLSSCLANGVVFRRITLNHISEAATLCHTGGKADIIINTTGLMACKLGGVLDRNVMPVRGQLVVVRNEAPYMITKSGTGYPGELCYIMTRAAGGGTILGGSYQKGSWDSQPDPNLAMRIMERAVEMMPEITNGKGVTGFDIIRHAVGLRPYREGGARVESEHIDGNWVVHNYGHGGWGYQGSYGCSERVVELVDEITSLIGS